MFSSCSLLQVMMISLLFSCSYAYAEDKADLEKTYDADANQDAENNNDEPPKVGNFSLPASQQPAALFGFGGNIIDKGEIQIFLFADYFKGNKKIVTDILPSVLFGVSKDFSIFFSLPFTPVMKEDGSKSSGLEDFFVQIEYAFYNKSTATYVDQATILANITSPTGSISKVPQTGFGSPSFFLGATYYHVMVDWFAFTAPGAILTTSDHRTKFGNQFLYQFGLGKNISSPEGWIYAWMIEIDGQYNQKNRIDGSVDDNSGGNVIYITPSGWVSTNEMVLQFGVSLPLNQNLFDRQHKIDYALNFNFSWSFY